MDTQPFLPILGQFKAVFLDSYGVLKNHRGLIEGVQQTVDYIRERGIALRILTNDASRSQHEQFAAFRRLGLQGIEEDEIITSGMLAKQYLQHKVKSGRIAYLGTENAASYILESGNTSIPAGDVDLERADEIDAFVFLDDEGFDWNRDINT
ncbi:MAG: TIGR01459 family HAD-type hydrolase, partial [Phaeodactylibacter sp.]|nr:TIGR01459 family HAD-type hydrolase [Phaeodactylibacter sp.]